MAVTWNGPRPIVVHSNRSNDRAFTIITWGMFSWPIGAFAAAMAAHVTVALGMI